MHTNHPLDSIPAYVLGALVAEEALHVRQHVSACATCRAEAAAFQAVVALLPYAAGAQHPPARVRRRLMARVAAARDPAQPGDEVLSEAGIEPP